MFRNLRFRILICFILAIMPLSIYASPDFPDGGEEPPGEVPIDGGVSLLIAAGAAYGYKKHKEQKAKNRSEQNNP